MYSARLEWLLGDLDSAQILLAQAAQKHQDFPELWLMRGQIAEQQEELTVALAHYKLGMQHCPTSIPLIQSAADLESRNGDLTRSRALLENGRITNPSTPLLWIEAVRLEVKGGNTQNANTLMANALQDCPNSGLLWSESIFMEPTKPQRKKKTVDALKATGDDDALVLMAQARIFLSEGKVDYLLFKIRFCF